VITRYIQTLVGKLMPDGHRNLESMPRNSVGTLFRGDIPHYGDRDFYLSTLGHFWNAFVGEDNSPAAHNAIMSTGFWTPPGGLNISDNGKPTWYWPMVSKVFLHNVIL